MTTKDESTNKTDVGPASMREDSAVVLETEVNPTPNETLRQEHLEEKSSVEMTEPVGDEKAGEVEDFVVVDTGAAPVTLEASPNEGNAEHSTATIGNKADEPTSPPIQVERDNDAPSPASPRVDASDRVEGGFEQQLRKDADGEGLEGAEKVKTEEGGEKSTGEVQSEEVKHAGDQRDEGEPSEREERKERKEGQVREEKEEKEEKEGKEEKEEGQDEDAGKQRKGSKKRRRGKSRERKETEEESDGEDKKDNESGEEEGKDTEDDDSDDEGTDSNSEGTDSGNEGTDSDSDSSSSGLNFDDNPEEVDDNSAARHEWLRQKPNIWRANRGLDRIMCMVGVEKAKAQFLSMKASIEASQRRGEKLHGKSINIEVMGGDGTGKESIRKHFKAFKDDLYDWSDDDIDVSKSHCTTRTIQLDNFTDPDIHAFLKLLFKKRNLEVEGGVGGFYTEILARRIGRGRDQEGFRNFWAIKDVFVEACDRQADRLYEERLAWEKNGSKEGEEPDDRYLTKEDLLGKPPPDLRKTSEAYRELQAMVGLDDIKKAVEELMDRARVNYRLEMRGKKLIETHLNRVIIGPPGTGKTTVAHLFGRIICDLGLVSKKEVVAKDPSDFNSKWIGGPQANTKKILEETQGKVLIIDDAHTLCPSDNVDRSSSKVDTNRFEILDTIVAKTSAKPNQDRSIIMVGYPEQMHDMFFKGNRGLRSRFPPEEAFEVQDYSLPHLMDIFDKTLREQETEATPVARDVASQILGRARDRPNFGNGRDVENLVNRARSGYRERIVKQRAEAKMEAVIIETNAEVAENEKDFNSPGEVTVTAPELNESDENPAKKAAEPEPQESVDNPPDVELDPFEVGDHVVLEPEDLDPNWKRASGAGASCEDLFKEFVGFDQVVQQFRGYQQIAAGMRLHGRDPRPNVPFTFIFKGPPGTGKTSTARKIGQIFYDMGFLASTEVVECSATDLIGQYLGHTGPQVQAIMEKALGKVLFIDEAYRLGSGTRGASSGGSFEEEAVGELVDSLTKPRYMRKMVIILAGYSEDMDLLMKSNRGLRGRFATEVIFPQLSPAQCLLFLGQLLGKMDITIRDRTAPSSEDKGKVQRLLAKLSATRDWSNGRDIETLSQKIVGEVFMMEGRRGRKSARLQVSTRELIGFLQDMLRARLAGELQDRE